MIIVTWEGGTVFWNGPNDVDILSADPFDATVVEQALADPVRVFKSVITGKEVETITEVIEVLEADGSEDHARAALMALDGAVMLDTSE